MALQVNIEKLNANNYGNWCADVKYILIDKNAWSIVNGSETLPLLKDDNVIEVKDFQARARAASAIIYLNIEAEYRRIIEDIDNPKTAWEKLKSHFFPDNRARHMQLFSEVLACRINEGESVDMFAARLKRINSQLAAMNVPMKDDYLSFQLLRYLPPQFDSMVQSILRWEDKKFMFKDILNELVAEESRLKLRDEDKSRDHLTEAAHVTKTRKPRKKVCYRCGKPGHFKRQCRNKLPGNLETLTNSRSFSPDVFRPQRNPGSRSANRSPSPSLRFKSRVKDEAQVSYLIQSNQSKTRPEHNAWIFDTGATHHFCNDLDLYVKFEPLYDKEMAVAVNGVTFPIEGTGIVDLKLEGKIVRFGNVLYSPKLRRNLISGTRLDSKGTTFRGGEGKLKVYKNDETLFRATLKNGVYYVYPEEQKIHKRKVRFQVAVVQGDDLKVWHRRMAHVSPHLIEQTYRNNSVRGLPLVKNRDFHCETCKLNKHRRVSFKFTGHIRSKHPLELLHTDVWGPTAVAGRGGERYFLSIIDDFSRKIWVYPMRGKSEVFAIFKKHIQRAELFIGKKVKAVRSDNGGEFSNENFRCFFEEKGINHEFTNAYTPEQNGVAERMNRTIADGARSVLNETKISLKFWPEAILYFAYTFNRVCHKNQKKTPFELYGGHKPSVRHLKPFGSTAYVGVPRQMRKNKFHPKAKKGVLVGYALATKGYRIWLPDENKVIETINVSFNEDVTNLEKHNGRELGPSYELGERNLDPFGENRERPNERPPPSPKHLDYSSENDKKVELRKAEWFRGIKTKRAAAGGGTEVYYYEDGKNQRLKSLKDVSQYCLKNNIEFEPELFNFQGSDNYEGIVRDQTRSSRYNSDSENEDSENNSTDI